MAMNDEHIPLYSEAKLTRQEAIDEITDVILQSDIKPQVVQSMLQLIQKFLPVENTLPTTTEELFAAINACKYKISCSSFSHSLSLICSQRKMMCV